VRDNGHWFSYVYIMTLCKTMVIDFLMFTSRPFATQWSLISLCLHQDPLQNNGHGFSHHQGPLRGNDHRSLYIKTLYEEKVIDFLCHIEALCEVMVIDLFTSRPSTRQWSLISYVTLRPFTRQWSSISLHQDHLRDNGHWFIYQIGTLYVVMVTEYLDIDPLLGIDLISFSKSQSQKQIFFRSRPFTW